LALGELRLVQLRTLAPLALQLELPRELLEPLHADAPQMAQLEIHHRIGGRERIGQQPLEALELLLGAHDRALLLLQLVEELVPLTPHRAPLALDARAVPVELQELLRRLVRTPLQQGPSHCERPLADPATIAARAAA